MQRSKRPDLDASADLLFSQLTPKRRGFDATLRNRWAMCVFGRAWGKAVLRLPVSKCDDDATIAWIVTGGEKSMSTRPMLQLNAFEDDGAFDCLRSHYRNLKHSVADGDLEQARHWFDRIDCLQSQIPTLSDAAQEAFDSLGIAIATDAPTQARVQMQRFRDALRASSRSALSTIPAPPSHPISETMAISHGVTQGPTEELEVEAVDQELPSSASRWSIELFAL